jgi:hypothetical protein
MTEKTVPLGKDPALTDPSGINPEDVRNSSVAIDNVPGNPNETVNLGPDAVDDHGVEEDVPDDKTPKTEQIYPPTKGE